MGFSISWVAFSGLTADVGLGRLGLRRVGTKADYAAEGFTGSGLGNGWFLVVAGRDCESPIISPSVLASLSAGADVVACSIEEHVMFTAAEFWKGGAKVWRIAHDAQVSARHLEATGDLPQGYQEVLAQETARQDAEDPNSREVDFFSDIPLQVARSLTSFKHDDVTPGLDDGAFEVFEWIQAPSPKKQWWHFWR
jgi:hypothetical protein